MDTIKVTFKHLGRSESAELKKPTNKEHNEFAARRLNTENDEGLMKVRAAHFDNVYVKSSIPKEEIFDTEKAAICYTLFEDIGVEVKN